MNFSTNQQGNGRTLLHTARAVYAKMLAPLSLAVAVFVISASLHYANLVYLYSEFGSPASYHEVPSRTPFLSYDSTTFVALAENIDDHGFGETSFHKKCPGLPLLLFLMKCVFGTYFSFLLVVPLWVGAAGAAAVRLSSQLSSNRYVPVVAGLLFVLWPNLYQLTPLVLTDSLHACTAILALWSTQRALNKNSARWGIGGGLLWTFALLLRPTFLIVPILFLGLIAWKLVRKRSLCRVCVTLLVLSSLSPLIEVTHNYHRNDLAVVTATTAYNLASFTIPRVKEEMGSGSFRKNREASFRKYALEPTIKKKYQKEKADFARFFRAHPKEVILSSLKSIRVHSLENTRPYLMRLASKMYPGWMSFEGPWFMIIFGSFAVLGLGVVFRRSDKFLVVMLVLASGFVLGSLAITHAAGSRLRLPVEVILIPVVAIGVVNVFLFGRWLARKILSKCECSQS